MQKNEAPERRESNPDNSYSLLLRSARRSSTLRAPWKGATTQRVRNPSGELSLQPEAIGAVHGGNDMD